MTLMAPAAAVAEGPSHTVSVASGFVVNLSRYVHLFGLRTGEDNMEGLIVLSLHKGPPESTLVMCLLV